MKPENIIQRTCVTVEVPIDQRIPPKYIPKSLLEGAADALLTIIDGIDNVLRPIETIGKYLFYTCLAGTAISFVPILAEKYNCEYANVASTVTSAAGGGGQTSARRIPASHDRRPRLGARARGGRASGGRGTVGCRGATRSGTINGGSHALWRVAVW